MTCLGDIDMYVYRIEDSNHEGPYCDMNTADMLHHSDTIHPDCFNDKQLSKKYRGYNRYQRKYAFRSVKQVFQWFSLPELMLLQRSGYRFAKYDIDKVWIGRKQVVFKEPAKLVWSISINRLINRNYHLINSYRQRHHDSHLSRERDLVETAKLAYLKRDQCGYTRAVVAHNMGLARFHRNAAIGQVVTM